MDLEHKDAKSLAIRIGIALSAGTFSIIPVAYGAPSGGKVEAGNAAIVKAANGVISPVLRKITLSAGRIFQ